MNKIRKDLLAMQDLQYKEFHSKLIPTIEPEKIIGIRVPILREYAKQIYGSKEAEEFMHELPHLFYEENNLHVFLLEQIKEYDSLIKSLNEFLPYIDNWATCDSLSPKVIQKNRSKALCEIKDWISSEYPFVIRFGIEMLMKYYLEDYFKEEYLELVAEIDSGEYYVKMMVAWYFATALAKQYDHAVLYIVNYRLDPWIHNKTIQKAIESRRISYEKKQYLRSLKHPL